MRQFCGGRSAGARPWPGNSPIWRKSTFSGGDQGSCVEIADGHATVPVRDSKNPDGPALLFHNESFRAFTDALKASAL